MSDPFLGAKVRVGRAKELLNALKVRGREFWDRKPYVFFCEPDPGGLTKTYKCRLTEHVPGIFDLWIVEAIEHLRASLDYLGYSAALLIGKREPKFAYFPIADTAAMLDTNVIGKGRCNDLPPDVLAFFRSLQPYKGGKGGAIWVLNKLCNSGKHRFLTSVGLESIYAGIDANTLPPGSTVLPHIWNSEKNEISYFSVPLGVEPMYDFEVAFCITFGPIDPVAGQPAIPHLFAIADKIVSVVEETEVVVRRAGLIPKM